MANTSLTGSEEKQICRTCLRSENLAPIFTKVERHERYSMALYLSTGLQVKLGDGLPQLICNDCIKSMRTAMEFRDQSQKAQKTLLLWGYKRKATQPCSDPNVSNYSIEHHKKKVIKDETKIKSEISAHSEGDNDNDSDYFGEETRAVKLEITYCKNQSDDNFELEKSSEQFSVKESFERTAGSESVKQQQNVYNRFRELLEGPLGGPGPYACRACKKIFTIWNSFKTHAQIHLGFNFLCEQCGRTFRNSNILKRHFMTRHGAERTHRCQLCDYRAVDTDQLKVHVRREHTGDRPFVCDACGAAFRSRPHLITHLSVHQTLRPVQCPQCPATFKSSQHLMCHTSKVHRAQEWRGECYVCGKRYTKLHYVRRHVAKFHGVPLHQQQPVRKVRVQAD